MAAKSKSASRKPTAPAKKSSAKKSKAVAAVKKIVRKAVKKATKKATAKKAVKAALKKSARSKLVKHSKELQMQVVEFVRTNPSHEILHAAVEKFDIGYDHLKDWLKKEGGQVAEALEHLIASQKKTVLKKGEEKLGELVNRFKKARKK